MLMAHAGPALTNVMSSRPGQASFKSLSQKNKVKMGREIQCKARVPTEHEWGPMFNVQ